eukprot:6300081-Prymnesium_polylepis.1
MALRLGERKLPHIAAVSFKRFYRHEAKMPRWTSLRAPCAVYAPPYSAHHHATPTLPPRTTMQHLRSLRAPPCNTYAPSVHHACVACGLTCAVRAHRRPVGRGAPQAHHRRRGGALRSGAAHALRSRAHVHVRAAAGMTDVVRPLTPPSSGDPACPP